MVKSCSGHLKKCKSIENRMSKIFTNPILSFYTYKRKQKEIVSYKKEIFFVLLSKFQASNFLKYILKMLNYLQTNPIRYKQNIATDICK